MSVDVAINGVGRIGRSLVKKILQDDSFNLTGVCDVYDADELLYLLKYDSTQETLELKLSGNTFFYKNKSFEYAKNASLDSFPFGGDFLIEASGIYKKIQDFSKVRNNFKKIALTYTIDRIPICIYKLKEEAFKQKIFSMATCTAVPLVIVSDILEKKYGILGSFVSSVHSFNSNQALLDRKRDSYLASRSATKNIIICSTNAAKNAQKVLPAFKDKFEGNGIRVPTASTCILDISYFLKQTPSLEEVKKTLQTQIEKYYKEIISTTKEDLVAMDFQNSTYAGIVDESLSLMIDNLLKVVLWHDNENGYASYVLKTIKKKENEFSQD